MKAAVIALVLMGFIAGCANLDSMHKSMESSLPKAAAAPAERALASFPTAVAVITVVAQVLAGGGDRVLLERTQPCEDRPPVHDSCRTRVRGDPNPSRFQMVRWFSLMWSSAASSAGVR